MESSVTPEEAFGLVLRELRKEKRLTQEQLGFESGLHRTYVSLLERGLRSPSLATIFSLANVLDVAPDRLIGRVVGCLEARSKQRGTRRKARR